MSLFSVKKIIMGCGKIVALLSSILNNSTTMRILNTMISRFKEKNKSERYV